MHPPPHREGSPPLTELGSQADSARPGPARHLPPYGYTPCNQEAAGPDREGARNSPGPSGGGRVTLPPPRPLPPAGRGTLTHLATGHRVGDREGRTGTRAAAALSAGVPGAAPRTSLELCPTPALGARWALGTRELLSSQGGSGGGAVGRKTPLSRRPNAPRGGAACARAGRALGAWSALGPAPRLGLSWARRLRASSPSSGRKLKGLLSR